MNGPAASIFGKNMECYDLEIMGVKLFICHQTKFWGWEWGGRVLLGIELEASYAYVLCH